MSVDNLAGASPHNKYRMTSPPSYNEQFSVDNRSETGVQGIEFQRVLDFFIIQDEGSG